MLFSVSLKLLLLFFLCHTSCLPLDFFCNVLSLDSEGEEELPQEVPVNSAVSSYDQSNQEQDVVQDIPGDRLYYTGQGQTNG